MDNEFEVSPEVKAAAYQELERDPVAKEITQLNSEINSKQSQIYDLEAKLHVVKRKHNVSIKWRESVIWCLTIDSKNPRYFIKNVAGVYKCIAYKYTIDITPEIKTRITATLTSLFKEGAIGRTMFGRAYFYGLKDFFQDGLEQLKDEHISKLNHLIY